MDSSRAQKLSPKRSAAKSPKARKAKSMTTPKSKTEESVLDSLFQSSDSSSVSKNSKVKALKTRSKMMVEPKINDEDVLHVLSVLKKSKKKSETVSDIALSKACGALIRLITVFGTEGFDALARGNVGKIFADLHSAHSSNEDVKSMLVRTENDIANRFQKSIQSGTINMRMRDIVAMSVKLPLTPGLSALILTILICLDGKKEEERVSADVSIAVVADVSMRIGKNCKEVAVLCLSVMNSIISQEYEELKNLAKLIPPIIDLLSVHKSHTRLVVLSTRALSQLCKYHDPTLQKKLKMAGAGSIIENILQEFHSGSPLIDWVHTIGWRIFALEPPPQPQPSLSTTLTSSPTVTSIQSPTSLSMLSPTVGSMPASPSAFSMPTPTIASITSLLA